MNPLSLAACLASVAVLGAAGLAHGAPAPTPAPAERPAAETIRLTKHSPAYWRVTFANPPLNIVGPAEIRRMVQILDEIEADPNVKVVVFDSAVPGYFMAHYDLLKPLEDSTGMAPGPTGMHPVPDFMVRLARLKAVTISSIRGGPAASAANWCWPPTCASPAARRPSSRSSRSAPASRRAAVPWRACRAWSAGAGRWKS